MDAKDQEQEAAAFLYRTIMGFWIAPALAVTVQLRIPDMLADGPKSAAVIADACACDASSISRLLNALASEGVFKRCDGGFYAATAVSGLLCSDHPGALGHLLNTGFYGENLAAWTALEDSLRNGACAFDLAHGVHCFDYLDAHPDRLEVFAAAMSATTRQSERAVLDSHDFGDFGLAVDVGGNRGSLIGGLLERHTDARGIVFDRPETVEAGRASWLKKSYSARMSAVGGDFFETVPTADLYLLKMILHDWSDADSIRILRTIRRAIRPEGRIAIIEAVLPEDGSAHLGWGLDIVMMVTTGGRERTLANFEHLLSAAGFQLTSTSPTESIYSVMEAVPIPERPVID